MRARFTALALSRIRTHASRRPRTRQATCVAPLIALVALACSGDPSGPKNGDAPGTFTATLTGAASATLTGAATFVAQEGQGYEVEMVPRGITNGSGIWITAGTGRAPVGSYAVTPFTTPQSLPTAIMRFCTNTTVACYTDWGAYWETNNGAGRLEITQSTATALAGNLDVDLRTDTGNVSGGGPLTHVSVRFSATCSLTAGC